MSVQRQFAAKRTHKGRGDGTLTLVPMRDEQTGRRTLVIRREDEDDWGDSVEVTRAMVDFLMRELPAIREELYTGKAATEKA